MVKCAEMIIKHHVSGLQPLGIIGAAHLGLRPRLVCSALSALGAIGVRGSQETV